MAVLAKGEGEILDWSPLPDTVTDEPSFETGVITKSTEIEVDLLITVAHMDANDALSNYVTVSVMKKLGENTEDWKLHYSQQAGGGQALTEALDAESASGQKQIKVAATGDFDTGLGERLLLYNVGDLALSEVVMIDGWADADYYIANENLANTHDAGDGDALYNGVNEITVRLPKSVETTKVTFHNSDDDANYLVRVDYSEVTGIA